MKKLTLYKVEINACALFIYERITLWQSYKCNGRMVILNICHHFDLPCVNYQLTDEARIWDCLECDTGAHVMGESSHGIISSRPFFYISLLSFGPHRNWPFSNLWIGYMEEISIMFLPERHVISITIIMNLVTLWIAQFSVLVYISVIYLMA